MIEIFEVEMIHNFLLNIIEIDVKLSTFMVKTYTVFISAS